MDQLDKKIETIESLARAGQWERISPLLESLHANDMADLVELLPAEFRKRIFELIPEDEQPDVLSEIELEAGQDVVAHLPNDALADIVEDMSPDDAADFLGDLDDQRSEDVLNLMEDEESEEVRGLLRYDEESAGGIMTPDVLALKSSMLVSDALDFISGLEEDEEPFYNVYVVGEHNHLVGSVGLWELIQHHKDSCTIEDLAQKDIVSATTSLDQEEVARLISHYDLTSLPVVDSQNRLVGRITVDDVIDVIEEEASEDIFRLAGSSDEELDSSNALTACRLRLPWLLVTLATGVLTSTILRQFMTDFSQVLALSFFVPVVTAMGGNTGIQSSTLLIRGMALDALGSRNLIKVLRRELAAGAIMGLICGLAVGGWAYVLITKGGTAGDATYDALHLGITVGVAMMAAMTFAALFGAIVPFVFDRLKIDPAVASGPFVTSSNDILALLIYYAVAVVMLQHLAQPLTGG